MDTDHGHRKNKSLVHQALLYLGQQDFFTASPPVVETLLTTCSLGSLPHSDFFLWSFGSYRYVVLNVSSSPEQGTPTRKFSYIPQRGAKTGIETVRAQPRLQPHPPPAHWARHPPPPPAQRRQPRIPPRPCLRCACWGLRSRWGEPTSHPAPPADTPSPPARRTGAGRARLEIPTPRYHAPLHPCARLFVHGAVLTLLVACSLVQLQTTSAFHPLQP